MNLKNLPKMWGQYQTWLKNNGITKDNIKDKIPELIQQIKNDPAKAQELKNFLSNPQTKELAHKLNISDNQLNEMSEIINTKNDISKLNNRTGNLSQEQMDLIKKIGRGAQR